MKSKPPIANSYTVVKKQPRCVGATFYHSTDNSLFPISATDDRGTFYGLDYETIRPHLVEIIHSKPHVIRGNHVHKHCTEIFTVLSGEITMYLSCTCSENHLFEVKVTAGMSVTILPGTAHAIFTSTESECVAVFGDGDPRSDRDRVMLLEY